MFQHAKTGRLLLAPASLVVFEKLQPLQGEATEITLWTSGGKEYSLFFRPLLPDATI